MKYLKQFDITEEEIGLINQTLTPELIENFEVMRISVVEALSYLKDFGAENLVNIILYRPDLCFRTMATLEQNFSSLDKELLVFILNNSIDDLTNFNI